MSWPTRYGSGPGTAAAAATAAGCRCRGRATRPRSASARRKRLRAPGYLSRLPGAGTASRRSPRNRTRSCGSTGAPCDSGASTPPWGMGRVTKFAQFALDPLVAPHRVLVRHPLDQRSEALIDGRAPRSARVGPLPGDQAALPAQDRACGDQPVAAHGRRQQPNQRDEDRTVRPIQARLRRGSSQHGNLVAQHQQAVCDRLGIPRSHCESEPGE